VKDLHAQKKSTFLAPRSSAPKPNKKILLKLFPQSPSKKAHQLYTVYTAKHGKKNHSRKQKKSKTHAIISINNHKLTREILAKREASMKRHGSKYGEKKKFGILQ